MILLLIILFFVYLQFVNNIRNRLLRQVIKFFVVLYCGQILLAVVDPYNIYPLSPLVFALFNIQIFFMILGAKQGDKKIFTENSCYEFKWPKVNINSTALILISVLLLYSMWNYQRMQTFLLTEASMTQEARAYYYSTFFASYTLRVLDSIICSFKYVAFILSLLLLFTKTTKLVIKEIFFVVASAAIFIFQTLISQGRLEVMVLLFFVACFIIISRVYDSMLYKRRILPSFLLILGGLIVLFVMTTLLRSNLTTESSLDSDFLNELIIKPFASYFYVPILAFDFGRSNVLNFNYPFMGMASLAPFIDTLLLPLATIDKGFNSFTIENILGGTIGVGHNFPSGEHWMAMYTGAANYYLDFWYIGFFIGPIIHGRIMAYFANFTKKNAGYFILFVYLFYCTFRHTTAYEIQNKAFVFFLFWVWFVVKNHIIAYKK